MDIDDAMKRAGHFGRFQKNLLAMMFIFQILGCAVNLSITFIGLPPDWTCMEEKNSSLSLTEEKSCAYYEQNKNCTPVYGNGFHSLTREVSDKWVWSGTCSIQ